MRGPHREAMSSFKPTMWPALTASIDRPARPGRDRVGVLAAADRVGEDDEVWVGFDDVLGRELRVARVGTAGRVGDAPHSEQLEQRSDERRRGHRVVGRIQLVVVGEGAAGFGVDFTIAAIWVASSSASASAWPR